MEFQSKYQAKEPEGSVGHTDSGDISDIHNIRLRNSKFNAPMEAPLPFSQLTLNTGDYQWSVPTNTHDGTSRYKHNRLQMVLLIVTALSYSLYALRAHIPDELKANSSITPSIKPVSIARVYTPDIRPNFLIENFLLRFAETCQALWLIYILSYIPRRSYFGYVYRYPDIFNSLLLSLLLISLSFEVISQSRLNRHVSCACLFGSCIILSFVCRLVALKLIKYQEKIKFIDFIMGRYFVLNSLFLFTTTVLYQAICFAIEHYTYHLTPYIAAVTLPTTLGLSSAYILIWIYFLFDRFVYESEFRPIWTPYLFVALVFMFPPLRHYISPEINLITEGFNYYFLWILFLTTIMMVFVRIWRQMSIVRVEINKRRKYNAYKEQASIQAET